MFENRTEPAFGVTRVEDPKTSSLRYQLVGWCELIAREMKKARQLGNRSETVVQYLLSALEASSELSVLDACTLTTMLLRGDVVLQLAQALAEETDKSAIDELEHQVADAIDAIETPDEALIVDMVAQGAGYLPESRLASLGAERFALVETLSAAVCGAASNLRRALSLSEIACKALSFEALGLERHLESLKPKERREKRASIEADVADLRARVENWRAKNEAAFDGLVDALVAIADVNTSEEALFSLLTKVGAVNADALESLEKGTFGKYGEPSPVGVLTSPKQGKCVLFLGDDFDVLAQLLDQAEYNEVDVWTGGDAIAAHGFKQFHDKPRLVGHYGGSWRDQRHSLGAFPGGIVVASAPIDEPDDSYAPYMFSVDSTRWESVKQLPRKADGSINMISAIHAAKDSCGFFRGQTVEKLPIGFGGSDLKETVDHAARAYRDNRLSKVYVVGGQDAPGAENDYFTKLFASVPEDSFVVSFGDVKFRFDRSLITPTIFGVTKLVDVGRERDANAALRFASLLASELDKDAATAPVEFYVSLWGEPSVAFLLSLCALGYRNIVVGPNLPACWTPAFVDALRERFNVQVADPDALEVPAAEEPVAEPTDEQAAAIDAFVNPE